MTTIALWPSNPSRSTYALWQRFSHCPQPVQASASTNGAWDGPGIRSSAAAAQPDRLTALGVLDNADPKVGGKTRFADEDVDATSVLLKYTWWGDANFDGIIDANDYDRIDKAFLFQTGPLGDGGPGAIPAPEPATLALLVLGAVGLAARRRMA